MLTFSLLINLLLHIVQNSNVILAVIQDDYNPTLVHLFQEEVKPTTVGGQISTNSATLPWIVAIYRDGEFRCAGTIINSNYVLTAGKCLLHDDGDDYARNVLVAGESYLECGEGQEQYRIPKQIKRSYGPRQTLVLIKVDEPWILDDEKVKAVSIIDQFYRMPEKAVLGGWGRTGPYDPLATGVRLVTVTKRDEQFCNRQYRAALVEKDFICYGKDNGRSGCNGDEGSPLLCEDRGYLCGVAFITQTCGRNGSSDLYVALTNPMLTWLFQQMEMDAPEDPHPVSDISWNNPTDFCHETTQTSSVRIKVANIGQGQNCYFVIKMKYKRVRYYISESNLLTDDRVLVSSVCDRCEEILMETPRFNYTTYQSSLVMVILRMGSTANHLRNVTLELYSSGYPDNEKALTETRVWGYNPPRTVNYPDAGEQYWNDQNVMIFLDFVGPPKRYTIKFNLVDTRDDSGICRYDYFEFYFTQRFPPPAPVVPYGKHIKFMTVCGNTKPNTFKWPGTGYGFIRFKSDARLTALGLEILYS